MFVLVLPMNQNVHYVQRAAHHSLYPSVAFQNTRVSRLGLLSLILKNLIKSLMQKSDIVAYIRLALVVVLRCV